MRVIDIGINKIDKIYHIADVHVRNVKRHNEYRLVFKRLYSGKIIIPSYDENASLNYFVARAYYHEDKWKHKNTIV